VDGRVILYADHMTGSLDIALAETERRRAKQAAYNEAHGITPESIKKQVGDIIRHVAEQDYVTVDVGEDGQGSFAGMDLASYIGGLETKMKEAAANLEFEEAARLRDEIRRLEASELGVKMAPTARAPARAESQRLRTQEIRARAERAARARRQRAASGRR
jgi:excinuclease ABC subunit B